MTQKLLVISVGPVQGFITAARRTRDLWFGSHLLSEVSKAAARSLAESGCTLIFPALDVGSPDLAPSDKLDALNVSNIILAAVPDEINLLQLKSEANNAAQERWENYTRDIFAKVNDIDPALIRQDIWDVQVNDVLEFYSAWVPLETKSNHTWQQARARVMQLLAGRKACRDFRPANGFDGVPKSSLDGARESVLTRTSKIPNGLRIRLRLGEGNRNPEQLCAVGFVKRLGAGRVPFPSVSRVAVDPWVRRVKAAGGELSHLLDQVQLFCKETSFAAGTGDYYPEFPFDGEILYDFRGRIWLEELEQVEERDQLVKINDIVKSIQKGDPNNPDVPKAGVPNPYYAILEADGDRMGAIISNLQSLEENRHFSKALASFSVQAAQIIREHHGFIIYAGGDDVVAFLPLDECLQAGRELHDTFSAALGNYPYPGDTAPTTPTLSIGIAIAHFLEPLEDVLMWGRDAENAAKNRVPKRDGLAISFYARGGNSIMTRDNWVNNLDEKLKQWRQFLEAGAISNRTVYDLKQLARDYEKWDEMANKIPEIQVAIAADIRRALKKKQPREPRDSDQDVYEFILQRIFPRDQDVQIEMSRIRENIMKVANELSIARKLAGGS